MNEWHEHECDDPDNVVACDRCRVGWVCAHGVCDKLGCARNE